jgi:hypothetical protein
VPECAGSEGAFWPITPELADQPAEPDSKPGLAIFCAAEQPLVPVTVSVNVVECDPDAAAPVIVIGYVPVAVDDATVSVSVDDEPDVTVLGENDAVTPVGRPLALSDTDSALPEATAVETVAVPFDPSATLAELGLTEIEKSVEPVELGPNAATPLGVPRPVGPS